MQKFNSEILSILEHRLAAGNMRFHEFRGGVLTGRLAREMIRSSRALSSGRYLVARAPGVTELWAAWRSSLATGVPLVLLPPASLEEENFLLSQLPAIPPENAALVLFNQSHARLPKAVFHTEASLLVSARQMAQAFPGHAPMASLLPACGMSGVMFHCLLPALRGSDLVFSSELFSEWAMHAGHIFHELDVELLSLTPSLLELFHRAGLDHEWRGTVASLTAPLGRAALAKWALASGRRPKEIYGMMEAAGPVLLDGRSLGIETRLSENYRLELRGPQLFMGYGMGGTFRAARANRDTDEWFRTDDIFTLEDGVLVHQARETSPALQRV